MCTGPEDFNSSTGLCAGGVGDDTNDEEGSGITEGRGKPREENSYLERRQLKLLFSALNRPSEPGNGNIIFCWSQSSVFILTQGGQV